MLLPGPEAQQLATYIGWLLHKTPGGLFVMPGFFAILFLSILYADYHDTTFMQALFFGIKPAVLVIVLEAVQRIGKRALKSRALIGIAALAFVAIFFFNIPFPVIVLAAGTLGYLSSRLSPETFTISAGHVDASRAALEVQPEALADALAKHSQPSPAHTIKVACTWLLLWLGPLAFLIMTMGEANIFVQQGVFFSKLAVVTFGGAYAVLAYLAQEAVPLGWLQPGEMLDGLGMAETTPGPLIQMVQFVAFMGAYRHAGGLDPIIAGVLASVLVTWMTYTPCFLWIFVGAPYIEYLRSKTTLHAMLSGITGAVVGVILNLAIWFALHTLFKVVEEKTGAGLRLLVPAWRTLDLPALLIALAAFIAMFRCRISMLKTLAGCAAAGLFYHFILKIFW